MYLFFAAIFLIGIKSAFSFSHNRIGDKKGFLAASKALQEEEIYHVFCYDPLQQWQLMFYSQERITCRYKTKTDRYLAFVKAVNLAYKDPNFQTAFFIGYTPTVLGENSEWRAVDSSFVYLPNPSKEVLDYYGFEFQ